MSYNPRRFRDVIGLPLKIVTQVVSEKLLCLAYRTLSGRDDSVESRVEFVDSLFELFFEQHHFHAPVAAAANTINPEKNNVN